MAPSTKGKGKADDDGNSQQRCDDARKIDEALARAQKKKQGKKKPARQDDVDDGIGEDNTEGEERMERMETEQETRLRSKFSFLPLAPIFRACLLTH